MCLILRARNDYCVGVYCICTYAALLGVRGLDGACISGTYGSSGPGQSLYQNLSYSLQQMNSIATLLKDLCKALQAASKAFCCASFHILWGRLPLAKRHDGVCPVDRFSRYSFLTPLSHSPKPRCATQREQFNDHHLQDDNSFSTDATTTRLPTYPKSNSL